MKALVRPKNLSGTKRLQQCSRSSAQRKRQVLSLKGAGMLGYGEGAGARGTSPGESLRASATLAGALLHAASHKHTVRVRLLPNGRHPGL